MKKGEVHRTFRSGSPFRIIFVWSANRLIVCLNKSEAEIDCIEDDDKIKKQTDKPSHFSLPTTFKDSCTERQPHGQRRRSSSILLPLFLRSLTFPKV
jgi:hypothetical protein